MKRILLGTTLDLTAATASFAGSADTAVVEPVPAAPIAATPISLGGDWTGGYVGLSFGNLDIDTDDDDDNTAAFGLHGGYDYDFGQFVLGGELEYQTADDFDLDGLDVEDIFRVKVRGGYDLGQTLIYGVVGGAQLNTDDGDDTGFLGGVGLEYRVTDQFSVGGEFLAHRFDDFDDTGDDIDANTFSIRGSFRF